MFSNICLTFIPFVFSEISDLFSSGSISCPSIHIVFSPMPAEVATVEIGFFLRRDGRAEVAGGEARGRRVGDASLGKGDMRRFAAEEW